MTEPLLSRTTFILEFTDVTGPPFRVSYARVDMLSESAEVTVRLEDGEPTVSRVRVFGNRAKKDGTAGQLPAEGVFFFAYPGDTPPPPHVQAAADEALRLVRDMLRGTGEVTV